MKTQMLSYALSGVLALTACSTGYGPQSSPAAQNDPAHPTGFIVTDLGPVGTPFGEGNWINNAGVVAGLYVGPDFASHAFLAANGTIEDISQPGLGGPNSGAISINQPGLVVGQAETSSADPNTENFCGFGPSGLQCLGFVWQNGVMTPLQPLGGTNSSASAINSRGEIAGFAETATQDPECPQSVEINGNGPQKLDYEAVIWGPKPGQVRELSPLPGDTVGAAIGINARGQAVGISGRCGNSVLPGFVVGPHAVMWDSDGSVHDLGSFGGTSNLNILAAGNAALAINDAGVVVGSSTLSDNIENQPFIWTSKTGMQHLALLSGDVVGAGLNINNRGEVVGASISQGGPATGNPKAVLWSQGADGPITDLNNYIAGSPFDGGQLLTAFGINDRGQITGFGALSDHEIHAFLLTPCNGNSAGCQDGTAHGNSTGATMNLTRNSRGKPI